MNTPVGPRSSTPSGATTHGDGARPDRRSAARWLGWLCLFLLAWASELVRIHVAAHGRHHVGGDFAIFWTSAHRLRTGGNPYLPSVGHLGFVYPPFALLPFVPLSLLSSSAAYMVWLAMDAAFMAAVVALAVRHGLRPTWAPLVLLLVMLEGHAMRTAWFGQLGFLLVGLVVLDVVGLRRHRAHGVLTGVAIGLKFTPAVFLVWFLARRQWRAAATVVASFLATVLLGVLVTPHWSRRYWSDLVVHHSLGAGVPSWYGSSNNQGLINAIMMLMGGVGPGQLRVAKVVAWFIAALALLAGALAARMKRTWLALGVLGVASCLATSSTWDHHYLWIALLLIAAAMGELRDHWVSLVILAVWTLWSFGIPWVGLIHVHLDALTTWQLTQAVATPVLAALLCMSCLVGLLRTRRRPVH